MKNAVFVKCILNKIFTLENLLEAISKLVFWSKSRRKKI